MFSIYVRGACRGRHAIVTTMATEITKCFWAKGKRTLLFCLFISAYSKMFLNISHDSFDPIFFLENLGHSNLNIPTEYLGT